MVQIPDPSTWSLRTVLACKAFPFLPVEGRLETLTLPRLYRGNPLGNRNRGTVAKEKKKVECLPTYLKATWKKPACVIQARQARKTRPRTRLGVAGCHFSPHTPVCHVAWLPWHLCTRALPHRCRDPLFPSAESPETPLEPRHSRQFLPLEENEKVKS